MTGASVTGPDIATWVGLAGLFLTIIGLYVKQREATAVNARRLDVMEQWQKEKSIDRSELKSVEDKAFAADAALRDHFSAAHREHDTRMVVMEREAKDNAKLLSDLRLEVARIPEQLRRQDDIQELRHKAVEHSLANLKMMVRALGKRAGVIVEAAAEDA